MSETVRDKYDRDYTSATCYVCRDLWDEIERLERAAEAERRPATAGYEARAKYLETVLDDIEAILHPSKRGHFQRGAAEKVVSRVMDARADLYNMERAS